MILRFTALGRPVPQGSKRAVPMRATGKPTRIAMIEDNPHLRSWRGLVAEEARIAMLEARAEDLFAGAIDVVLTFNLLRPKSHFGTGRNASRVLPSAPPEPAVMPDIDKLVRGVLDALTGVVFRDDAQVTSLMARKTYGTPERLEVVVRDVRA